MTKKPEVLILSAVSQEKMTKEAINLGASCFMLKPFDLEVLAKRILNYTEQIYLGIFSLKKKYKFASFAQNIQIKNIYPMHLKQKMK